MKTLFTLLSLGLASASAYAAAQPVVVDFSKDAKSITAQNGIITFSMGGDGAQKIYDFLEVPATPTQDITEFHKTAAGLACYDLSGDPRLSGCTLQIDANKGVVGAVAGQVPANPLTISLSDDSARTLYEAMNAAEKTEDAESMNFSKTLPGISAQRHQLTNTYDVVIVADPAKGILK